MFSLYNPIKFLAILYPKSLATLVVGVGTRHSHQILLEAANIYSCSRCSWIEQLELLVAIYPNRELVTRYFFWITKITETLSRKSAFIPHKYILFNIVTQWVIRWKLRPQNLPPIQHDQYREYWCPGIIESIKTTFMENVSTGVLEKIKNNI